MRPTTALRRAVIAAAAAALCAVASAPGATVATPLGLGFSNVAAAEAAAGGLTSRPAADPVDTPAAHPVDNPAGHPDPAAAAAATRVSDLVDAAAAAISGSNTPGDPEGLADRGSTAASATAPAPSTQQPLSTPVPIATPDGRLMSYVVNAAFAGPAPTQRVAAAVRRSGGVVVQAWPQIGVVIAHSRNGSFRSDVKAKGAPTVVSVGATRSVAVTGGTPAGDASADGPFLPTDAAGSASAADSAANGSPTEPQPDTTATPDPATAIPTAATPDQATPDPATPDTATQDTATPTAATPDPATAEAATPLTGREGPDLDPLETDQWDLSMIKADRAHNVTDGARRVVVGVLDSGIDADHPDLVANLDVADSVNCSDAGRPDLSPNGWKPTSSDHGTHVAGTIAAARNGIGMVGVAPKVRVASVKVVDNGGYIYPEYAVCGFVWAGLRGIEVTNNSYYIDPFQFYCSDQPDQAAAKEAVRRAVAWSTAQGVVHAAAAGNSAYDLANKTTDNTSPDDGTPVKRVINNGCQDIPTELPGVVTVSSLAQVGNTLGSSFSQFSNRGLGKIDVAAPGSGILSTVIADDGYGLKSGTSMATPHVAGVLALMKSRHPAWKPAKLIAELLAQADPKACPPSTSKAPCVGTAAENSYFGHGVVDALDAVR